ncbi:MAG: PTS sugar transporter subunit IIA [Gemmobacter sp.]
MDIAALLKPEGVRVFGTMTSKKRLFQELGELAGSVYGIDAGAVTDGLQERETLGPTGVGHGIALPHARLDGLDRIRGLFVRLDKPMDFDSVDRQPVDLVFALLAPKDAGVEHLKALALISRTMRDAAVVAKLRANHAPATLHAILSEARPNNQAA